MSSAEFRVRRATPADGYVSSVYVVPELRNAGIGSALLETCLVEADVLQLDAVVSMADRAQPPAVPAVRVCRAR
jgi:ribosomal protein S18 acetylase RimI-like enzyme